MDFDSLMALDVGGGTQDLLLWRADEPIENAIKMVLPAPTQVVAGRIRQARLLKRAVFLHGWLMGGGALGKAVKEHIKAGLKVFSTEESAFSLADDLDRVRALGVEIVETAPTEAMPIFTTDLDILALRQACGLFGVLLPPHLALAVCDHGFSPGGSNRKFRFQLWRDFLAAGGDLADLITNQPPAHLTRMKALTRQMPGALVMDTAAAGLWGALQDPEVGGRAQEGVCVVNLGNMHTVGFLLKGRRVLGVYEHHTRCLDMFRLAEHIGGFIAGSLSDQEVFDDHGHGCARAAEAPTAIDGPVVITGPQRRLAEGLGWQTAVPFGDVMLSGCFGLVAAARVKTGAKSRL